MLLDIVGGVCLCAPAQSAAIRLSALVHEPGHALIGRLLGGRDVSVQIGHEHSAHRGRMFGIDYSVSLAGAASSAKALVPNRGELSWRVNVLIALGGPLADALCAVTFGIVSWFVWRCAGIILGLPVGSIAARLARSSVRNLVPSGSGSQKSDGRQILEAVATRHEDAPVRENQRPDPPLTILEHMDSDPSPSITTDESEPFTHVYAKWEPRLDDALLKLYTFIWRALTSPVRYLCARHRDLTDRDRRVLARARSSDPD